MSFYAELRDGTLRALAGRGPTTVALLGVTAEALRLAAELAALPGVRATIIEDPAAEGEAVRDAGLLVVCADRDKQRLLGAAAGSLGPGAGPDAVLAGTAHLDFDDPVFAALEAPALVPSYATGYPYTRVHLFQCLQAAAAHGLRGAIVEFGAFKGGTTVWLAKAARALGLEDCPVIGLDSWAGFPPRRSVLDLYEHPRCVFSDLEAVRAYTDPYGIELIAGDITETAEQLRGRPVLLAFVDTDNYSPAHAALSVVLDELVVGGAIVLDHYATSPDFTRTVGERMAAQEVLAGEGLLQLHGTGVFVKLR